MRRREKKKNPITLPSKLCSWLIKDLKILKRNSNKSLSGYQSFERKDLGSRNIILKEIQSGYTEDVRSSQPLYTSKLFI